MWWKEYQDYKEDEPLRKQRVEVGKGIVGCEMHEECGWGLTKHREPKPKKPGLLQLLLSSHDRKE